MRMEEKALRIVLFWIIIVEAKDRNTCKLHNREAWIGCRVVKHDWFDFS